MDPETTKIVVAVIGAAGLIIAAIINRKRDSRGEQPAPTASVGQGRETDKLQAAKQILDSGSATPPVLNHLARRFAELSTQSEKKKLIHPLQNGFANGAISLTRPQMAACAGSEWELDRIALYLFEEANLRPDLDARIRSIQQEWDEVTASAFRGSLVPLHYSIRSLLRLIQKKDELVNEARASVDVFQRILNVLRTKPHLDETDHVKGNLEQIIEILGNG